MFELSENKFPPPQPLCLWNFNFNFLVAGGGDEGIPDVKHERLTKKNTCR